MKTLFECSLCGNGSEDAAKIQKCENGHFRAGECEVTGTRGFSSQKPHPRFITVKFPNGSEIIYKED